VSFTAKYTGTCAADCGYRIREGDQVEYVEDQLMHVDCPDAIAPITRAVCPECFTETAVNGACSCAS